MSACCHVTAQAVALSVLSHHLGGGVGHCRSFFALACTYARSATRVGGSLVDINCGGQPRRRHFSVVFTGAAVPATSARKITRCRCHRAVGWWYRVASTT